MTMMKMLTIAVLTALLVLAGCTGKQSMRLPSLGNPCQEMVGRRVVDCTAEAVNDSAKLQACRFIAELGHMYCLMAQPPAESLSIKRGALVGCEYVFVASRGGTKRAWLMYVESAPDRPTLTPTKLLESMSEPNMWASKEFGWTLQPFQAAK